MSSQDRDVSAIVAQVNEFLLAKNVDLAGIEMRWSQCWQRFIVVFNRTERRYMIANGDDARLGRSQLMLILGGVHREIEKSVKERESRRKRYETEQTEEAEFMRFVSAANKAGLRTAVYDKGKFSIACNFEQALRIMNLIADNRESIFKDRVTE